MASFNQCETFAIVIGDHKEHEQAFLAIDNKVISEISVNNIPIFLLGAFYMLNICYPTGCQNVYKFLELIFLNISEKTPPSVKTVHTLITAKLHAATSHESDENLRLS